MKNKLCLIIALCLLCLNACGTKKHVVTFDLDGGTLVSGTLVQEIEDGKAAVAPNTEKDRMELSWDKDFSNVTEDIIVKAQWKNVAMDSVDLAEYVQERTVTVNVTTINGGVSAGSGFFIDDQGTILTNNHVIEMGANINVQMSGGGNYDVQSIIDFDPTFDLAILKIDMTGNPYLKFSQTESRTGEQVYAVGSALGTLDGTFTSGSISSTTRKVGKIECIQMDAAISHGNSGGPLVNVYGDVVGINTYSYANGENLNLAIKPSTLDHLKKDKNFSVNEFREWYTTESARSYSPYDGKSFHYSLVNTYQAVTGRSCIASNDAYDNVYEGYRDCYVSYAYEYVLSEFDTYTAYLRENGYIFQSDEQFDGGISYYYYNEKDGILLDLFVSSDNTLLLIFPKI